MIPGSKKRYKRKAAAKKFSTESGKSLVKSLIWDLVSWFLNAKGKEKIRQAVTKDLTSSSKFSASSVLTLQTHPYDKQEFHWRMNLSSWKSPLNIGKEREKPEKDCESQENEGVNLWTKKMTVEFNKDFRTTFYLSFFGLLFFTVSFPLWD